MAIAASISVTPLLAPSLSMSLASRSRISSLMRGPSLAAGCGALLGRRMGFDSFSGCSKRGASGVSGHKSTTMHAACRHDLYSDTLRFLNIGEGAARRGIAVRAQEGAPPGLFWLGAYKSDMKGTKAVTLADWAAGAGRACVRFDYSGHGESEGVFTAGTIGRWLADSLAVFDACCAGPQILIGSSMGGWLGLLLTREVKPRGHNDAASIAGMVLIAPAVDFTEELMWKRFTPEIKRELED